MEAGNEGPSAFSASKKQILIYGKHEYILSNVRSLLERSGYEALGFLILEELLDYMRMYSLDAVLIGGGVDPQDRRKITELVRSDLHHVKIIEHYGGPATILTELKIALEN